MVIPSNRVAQLWVVSGAVFATSVLVVRLLGRGEDVRMLSLGVGYVGLSAIGVALFLTWRWLNEAGPRSFVIRVPLRLAIVGAMLLWVLAMLFPFF